MIFPSIDQGNFGIYHGFWVEFLYATVIVRVSVSGLLRKLASYVENRDLMGKLILAFGKINTSFIFYSFFCF
jgi:hypothetical protein